MKKQIVVGLACMAMLYGEAYAMEIDDIKSKVLSISGTTNANTQISATVGDSELYYFYDEITSDESGKYLLKFELPEDLKNKKIKVSVKPMGMSVENLSFDYSGTKIRENALNDVVSATDSESLAQVLSNADYTAAFKVEGVDVSTLNADNAVKNATLQMIEEKTITKENFAKEINRCFFVSSKKNNYANGLTASFEGCDFEFENVKFSDEEDIEKKEWIKSNMFASENITSIENAEMFYQSLSAYYILNTAKYSDIPQIIEKYQKELGIEGTRAYISFAALSQKEKYLTAEKIAQQTGNLTSGFDNILLKSITKSSTGTTSGGSSGGGSKGSSSGAVNAYPVVTQPTEKEETTQIFKDVSDGAWYKEAVEELFKRNIVSGKDDEKFAPNDSVTREEFVAMLVRTINADGETSIELTDVKDGAWYEQAVKKAIALGIAVGYDNGKFGVGELITRQDAAVFTARASKYFNMDISQKSDSLFADDEQISDYAKDSVYAMRNNGIISGMEDNTFAPNANCTRAQAAVMIYRFLEEVGNK